jgi:hypothetical protein
MQLVTPFYLRMMRLNALEEKKSFLRAVVKAGRDASTDEVIALLRDDEWRPRVMGAWFALLHHDGATLLHDERAVGEAVLESLATSLGSLTSPPLAVVAVTLMGSGALSALERYTAQDIAWALGACGFVAAAIAHLGVAPTACHPTHDDTTDFDRLLAVAQTLQAAR